MVKLYVECPNLLSSDDIRFAKLHKLDHNDINERCYYEVEVEVTQPDDSDESLSFEVVTPCIFKHDYLNKSDEAKMIKEIERKLTTTKNVGKRRF